MRITHEAEDFRRYEPFIAKDKSGKNIRMMLCEELDPESDLAKDCRGFIRKGRRDKPDWTNCSALEP